MQSVKFQIAELREKKYFGAYVFIFDSQNFPKKISLPDEL